MDTLNEAEDQLAAWVWSTRYRYRPADGAVESGLAETRARVARALAGPEAQGEHWERAFRDLLASGDFLPAGRILAGAGTESERTLFNCFVMGRLEDSLDGIFQGLRESALTLQAGGGIGLDFSTLRPAGEAARRTVGRATGPVSFLPLWDRMCETVMAADTRRGAMMATLRCDHPDIEAFINAKRAGGLSHFNLSVLLSDDFLRAVAADAPWPLLFPLAAGTSEPQAVERPWPDADSIRSCRIHRWLPARALWHQMAESAWQCGDPGLLFVDRINRDNNLSYRETITATNPCGELPLPPYGACNLGSINLAALVRHPFSRRACLDEAALDKAVPLAVRMLDNAIDASRFPLTQQAACSRQTRRLGLGITGLADALIMLGLHYDSDAARAWAAACMRGVAERAYRASIQLARERGPFPAFEAEPYLDAPYIRRLPGPLRDDIARDGIRNSHLLAIAPTGSISLLAGNVSSGMEPVFAFRHRRRIRQVDGREVVYELRDHALRQWLAAGGSEAALPDSFVSVMDLPAAAKLRMQASLQAAVDNAISKTVNLPSSASLADCQAVLEQADTLGLKGLSLFRQRDERAGVLEAVQDPARAGSACCGIGLKGPRPVQP
ncbi:adenosylcobalamin-dependent ribonucleoside-diphosphate reductase [Natronospira bacteriovora]|uniref:Vitamin B12-dependent ribonucleotide reductase n=1 Tax=Natronospira bacteriovora TaxID=3069753 RepID=A0ABU0W514_9GAMM|nr:adenosylcobalamin-dependent ribonucleoside-diphosphate reductase [Natronospira sp. AB-CW4]MDQ2069044.1 adenosylcobalamin-dependent ribonucleoside-diphosphate reductase [Natronospira sp. AB-CW4]